MTIDNNKQMASLYSLYSARVSEQLAKQKRHTYDDMQIKAALDTLLAAPFRRCPRFMVDGWHSDSEECPIECGHCQGTGWVAIGPAKYNPLLQPLKGFHAGGYVHDTPENREIMGIVREPCFFVDIDGNRTELDGQGYPVLTDNVPFEMGVPGLFNVVINHRQNKAVKVSLLRRLLGKRKEGR